jgi:hypothetical protein
MFCKFSTKYKLYTTAEAVWQFNIMSYGKALMSIIENYYLANNYTKNAVGINFIKVIVFEKAVAHFLRYLI